MRWLVLVTCGCLGGSAPKYDYYVLAPTTPMAASAAAGEISVGVGPVSIPGYLDREQIAVRTGDNGVSYSKQDRWAEPLDQAFERSLRQDLAATLAADRISVPASTAVPTFEVRVEVLRFERVGDDRVELWARWTLRGDVQPRGGETRIKLAVAEPGSGAAAAALSRTIARLAKDIAGQVTVAARERRERQAGTR